MLCQVSFGQQNAEKLADQIFRYGMGRDFPPYTFVKDGKSTGFNVEIMEALCQELGFSLEVKANVWNQILEDFKQD